MSKVKINNKNRLKFKIFEFKILLLKSLLREKFLIKKFKLYLQIKLHKLCSKYSRVKINNRCIISYKTRSINRLFQVNRHTFKNFSSIGLLPGIEKTGW